MLAADGVRLWAIHWGYGPDIAWAGSWEEALVGDPVLVEVFLKNPFFYFFFSIYLGMVSSKLKKRQKDHQGGGGKGGVRVCVCACMCTRACVWCDFPFN